MSVRRRTSILFGRHSDENQLCMFPLNFFKYSKDGVESTTSNDQILAKHSVRSSSFEEPCGQVTVAETAKCKITVAGAAFPHDVGFLL